MKANVSIAHSTPICVALGAALLCAAYFCVYSAMAGPVGTINKTGRFEKNPVPDTANRPPVLRNLFTQFQSISSLYFSATVNIVMSDIDLGVCCENSTIQPGPAVNVNIPGEMEYFASGDRYRTNIFVNPAMYPGMDTQFAYDGEQFQLFSPTTGTLIKSMNDNATILMTLPNPMLQLLQFCYPEIDATISIRRRLKDIVHSQVPDIFRQKIRWAKVQEQDAVLTDVMQNQSIKPMFSDTKNGFSLEQARFPGGIYQDRQYVHHVYCVSGHRNRPFRIDRIAVDGMIMTSSSFSQYVAVDTVHGPTEWPKNIILREYNENGDQVVGISYDITDLTVNDDIPQEIFTISHEKADHIWDDKLEAFVK